MNNPSRREFIGLTGAGVAGAIGAQGLGIGTPSAAAQGLEPRDADLIVVNAKVYTMDAATPRAEAFAVKAGRIMAIGSSADIRGLGGKATETIDARQMTIVPGFIDCHNHAPGTTLLEDV